MAMFFRKDARMTIAISLSPAVSPRVPMTARQRACLEQIARRQTSPQRLVRRATILLALETGVTQCHVMRQMHLNRRNSAGMRAGGGAPSPPSWHSWKPTRAVTKRSPL